MQNSLRSPDPTLSVALDHVAISWSSTPPVAHLHDCPAGPDYQTIPPEHAAYIAVPCRLCFPSAPPEGFVRIPWEVEGVVGALEPDPGLAWQLGERNADDA